MRFLPLPPTSLTQNHTVLHSTKKQTKPTSGYKHSCLALRLEAFIYRPKHSNTEIWFLPPHTLNICLGHSQLFPFSVSLRNSYTHCPAIARHSGSAIDKDQRGDTRMGKGIQQWETEKPELRFLFCTGFPGSLGELPAAAISQHPALGATMAYGASHRPLGLLIWASPTACGKMPSQSQIFGLTP